MSEEVNTILVDEALYHVYESKAEDGNVVALRGLHVKIKPGEPGDPKIGYSNTLQWQNFSQPS